MSQARFLSQAGTPTHAAFSLLLAAAPSMAVAQIDDIARCRAIDDARQRLACYDAIALTTSLDSASPARGEAPRAAAGAPIAQFGLPSRASPLTELAGISSRLKGRIEGWQPNTIFLLDNGQQWQVIDGSRCVCPAENATIQVTRGVFGAYWLSIDGYNRTASVKRLR